MKLMIGFTTGFVAGAYVFSKLTEDQRREVSSKLDALLRQGRTGEVVDSVAGGVGNVADAVTERVTAATDTVATKTADVVSGDAADEYRPVAATTI